MNTDDVVRVRIESPRAAEHASGAARPATSTTTSTRAASVGWSDRIGRVATLLAHVALLPVVAILYCIVHLCKCCCAQRVCLASQLSVQDPRVQRAEQLHRATLAPDSAEARLELERVEQRIRAREHALETDECYDGLGCGLRCHAVRLWRWWAAYLCCVYDDYEDDALGTGWCAQRIRRCVQNVLFYAGLIVVCVGIYALIALAVTTAMTTAA